MGFQEIKYGGRVLRLRKAARQPNFDAKTVLVSDPWDYVDLWLRREKHDIARSYWEQAREFAAAAAAVPPTAAPLPAYYCFLNAVKALLQVRNVSTKEAHGVYGAADESTWSLDGEKVHFQTGGVLAALCRLLGEDSTGAEYSLRQAFYNLPYIHRAYTLTFTSVPELFIPIRNGRFVRKTNSKEAWFCAELEPRYRNSRTIKKLPTGWELDDGSEVEGTVRMKARFRWEGRRAASKENQERLRSYHQKVRQHVFYIYGPSKLWYLKRGEVGTQWVGRSSMTLTFAAMHRLSELSRYEPLSLRTHLERQHNFLLSEFVQVAPRQFVDEIASEITGSDFMLPGIRK